MRSTANNWILAYYQQIMDGSVTVGEWIRRWYGIVVHGLEEKRWRFDQKKANECINFIERYCHHHEGPLAPGLLKLELWQKAMLSVIYGIVDETGKRQFREVVLIIARKQGKTAMMSGVGCHHLFRDGGYGARVYSCATKLEQAKLCYEGIYQTIRKEPTMDRMTKRRRTDLYIEANNASASPLAFSAKKSDGLNVSLGILDEFAAFPGEAGLRQAEVIKSSQGAREEPLLFYTSTANFVDGGLYDEMYKRCTAVLNGTSKETRLAPFLYMIDDPEKWNDINELRKSMPNLGVSVPVDYILEEIAVAESSLSKRGEFLTKYCNIKQNSSEAWISAEDARKCVCEPLRLEDFHRTYGVVGVDLSRTTDLTCAGILIERGGVLHWICHFWLPSERIEQAIEDDNIPYKAYVKRGFLSLCDGHEIDYHDVEKWITDLLKVYKTYPLRIGYDRYSAAYLIQDLEAGGFKCDSVFQGENLTGIINQTEALIKDGLLRIGDNDLMKIHLLDAALHINHDTDRKKLVKLRKYGHIDGMAALLDAMCMRSVYHNEIGRRLENRPREGS